MTFKVIFQSRKKSKSRVVFIYIANCVINVGVGFQQQFLKVHHFWLEIALKTKCFITEKLDTDA